MIIYELTPVVLIPKFYATEELAKEAGDKVLESYHQHNAELDKKYADKDPEYIREKDLYMPGLVESLQWEEVNETFTIGRTEVKTGRTVLRGLVSEETDEDGSYEEYLYIKKIEVVDE